MFKSLILGTGQALKCQPLLLSFANLHHSGGKKSGYGYLTLIRKTHLPSMLKCKKYVGEIFCLWMRITVLSNLDVIFLKNNY